MGYYTAKQRCRGAVQGFILTTSTQHLKKCIMILKYITLKFILRCFYLKRNLADIGFLALLWPIGSIKWLWSIDPKILRHSIKWPYWYLLGSYGSNNKPIEGNAIKPVGQSMPQKSILAKYLFKCKCLKINFKGIYLRPLMYFFKCWVLVV